MASAARARLFTALATSALCVAAFSRSARAADTVVQVPVDSLIDGRSVSTLAGTTIVPWSAGQGVDGDGNSDGFVTTAVEAVLLTQNKTENNQLGVALPDDGKFAATTRYPEVQLHFSNAASNTSPQTHQVHISQGPQSFMFNVPQATYSKMFLFITCSEGAAALTITLNYAGGAAPKVTSLMLPDYGIGGAQANDPVFFNLIQGMHKWSTTDQEGDGPSHTITGIELNPSPTDMLTSIQVAKTNGSHAVFWGATGIATSPVDVGGGGAGGTGSGGAGGSGGAAAGSGGTSSGGSAGNTTGGASSAGTSAGGAAGTLSTGQAGAAASGGGLVDPTPNTSSSTGSCAFTGTGGAPARDATAWSALLLAGAVVLRRRRRA
ncbi:MAG TPA: hypothetical protein VNW92_04090 [Polyangiaceae bacterium]|jgi:MYXO-CTERM domain-containing protein|nr:hypothetical protein [Polyangiaceae bacterium]